MDDINTCGPLQSEMWFLDAGSVLFHHMLVNVSRGMKELT